MTRISIEHIRIILAAVAQTEGWDDRHPSISIRRDGGWHVTTDGKPDPSAKLLQTIRRMERGL